MTLFKVFDLYLSYLNNEVLKEGYPPTSYMALIKVYESYNEVQTDDSISSSYMALFKVLICI